jgi:hypothetical protein
MEFHSNGLIGMSFSLLLLLLTSAQIFGYNTSYCERPWPSLDLFMPLYLRQNKLDLRYYDIETLFLRTFLLFWPLKLSNTSLNIAIDAEVATSREANELRETLDGVRSRVPGGINITLLQPSRYYRKGYDRQQLVMFWADNFTDKEYVGFVDSDAAFITHIDREDLFEEGKPVVNAKSGNHPVDKNGVYKWAMGTYQALGILEPFRCMSYFPVIIKLSHLKDMREYISKYHNLPFDDVFYQNISSIPYSQFGIMCTYLWAFKRDEYKWYVHTITPKWDGRSPPALQGQDGNLSQFTPQMLLPKPRIATHVYYRRKNYNPIVRTFHRPVFCRLPTNA